MLSSFPFDGFLRQQRNWIHESRIGDKKEEEEVSHQKPSLKVLGKTFRFVHLMRRLLVVIVTVSTIVLPRWCMANGISNLSELFTVELFLMLSPCPSDTTLHHDGVEFNGDESDSEKLTWRSRKTSAKFFKIDNQYEKSKVVAKSIMIYLMS